MNLLFPTKQDFIFLKFNHPHIALSGNWDIKEDCAIGLDQDCSIEIRLKQVSSVYGIFVSHDWSGKIVIHEEKRVKDCEDLYSTFHYRRIIPLKKSTYKRDTEIKIKVIGKNEYSHSCQVVLCGLLLLKDEYSPAGDTELRSVKYFGEIHTDSMEFQKLQETMVDNWIAGIKKSGRKLEDVVHSRYLAYGKRIKHALIYAKDGDKVLDIGAGNIFDKILTDLIIPSNIDYWTLDIDHRVVEGTKQIFSKLGLNREQALKGENTFLPFNDQFFDVVFSSHCIEHSRDINTTFKEIWRIIKPDGYMIYAVPFGWDDTNEHLYALNIEDWIHATAIHNFDVLSWHIGKEYPELGFDLMIVGQKKELQEHSSTVKNSTNLNYIPFVAKTAIFQLVGTWQFNDDCAIGLHKGSKINIALKNVSFIQVHLGKNEWSAIISISINGIRGKIVDLYEPSLKKTEINIFESEKPCNINVEIEGIDKNDLSLGFQLLFYGLTIGYGDNNFEKDEFPWLSNKTKEKIVEYTGKRESIYRGHLAKYFNYINFFSRLNRHMKLEGCSVLEVGCGIGMSTVVLRQMGARVIAGDYDDGNTLKAARLIARDFYVDDSFQKIDIRNLKFNNEAFDYVHCEQVLEHIPKKDHEKALSELCRVVKKGGFLFIDTENNLCPFDRHDSGLFLVHWLPKKIGRWVAKRLNKGIKINELSFDNKNPILHDYLSYFEIMRIVNRFDFSLKISCFPYNNTKEFLAGQYMNSNIMDLLQKVFNEKSIYFLPIHFLLKKGNDLEEKFSHYTLYEHPK